MELVQDCCHEHLRMETARMKWTPKKQAEDKQKRVIIE